MGLATNITRRGAVYYIRIAVPKDLIEVLGRREVWKSLGTRDAVEARRLARPLLGQLDSEWQLLRQRRDLTQEDAESLIWRRYSEILEADDR